MKDIVALLALLGGLDKLEELAKEHSKAIDIKDFPQEVLDKMMDNQEIQGNKRDQSVFELKFTACKRDGGFDWNLSPEGGHFWGAVSNKAFDIFYEKYPKETSESIPMPEPDITHLDSRAIGDLKGFPSEIIDMMLERSSIKYEISEALECLQRNRKASSPGFLWSNTTEGHRFWDDVISDRKFDVFFEKYPKGSDTDIDKTPIDPEFPCLMEVSDYEDFRNTEPRVVFMKKQGKYLAWYNARTFEEAEEQTQVLFWNFARPVQKQQS